MWVWQSLNGLPEKQSLTVGDELKVELNFPENVLKRFKIYVEPENKGVLEFQGSHLGKKVISFGDNWPVAVQPGTVNLQLRLFGIFPIKNMTVQVVPALKVIPGGHSIGVLLYSGGVIVVGYSPIILQDGRRRYPAREAGLEVGDVILKINDQKVRNDQEAIRLINEWGQGGAPIEIVYKRKERTYKTRVKPLFCPETGRYRIGLFIRDSAAGIGTLTFYEPKGRMYGALGHIITDIENNHVIKPGEGRIVKASVQGIQPGRRGQPGEKIGVFIEDRELTGTIDKNTPFGIFGRLATPIKNRYYRRPIPVAFAHQVQEGPAHLLTVVSGDKIEKFSINIEKVIHQEKPDGKGLVIKITDPRLLELTGGIVQGMSGSPIIQNGRLVGAVTHVFVNDPTRGYGIMAEWMLRQTILKTRQISSLPGLFIFAI
ncbi:SpoIVB peptidase [Calderihabitans maritimus]|uniref:SpoIVB peptidase n=2 Tax=Calderihabitans maritimus TaxID=1246530 RepID=A0A1Z5HS10_9FIRM|nr:SpoIVB peptidase [Calderihabitans maritimus]